MPTIRPDSQLLTEAGIIKNEVTTNANTAVRVGTMLEDIIVSKANTGSFGLQQVTDVGSTTNSSIQVDTLKIASQLGRKYAEFSTLGGNRVYITDVSTNRLLNLEPSLIEFGTNYSASINAYSLTTNRTYDLPNKSGVIALTNDIVTPNNVILTGSATMVQGLTGSLGIVGTLGITGSAVASNSSSFRSNYYYTNNQEYPWYGIVGSTYHHPQFPYIQGWTTYTGTTNNTLYTRGNTAIGTNYNDGLKDRAPAIFMWLDTADSGVPGTPTLQPKPVIRTIISDNSSLDFTSNGTTVATSNAVTAHGIKHVLTVTGSFLARDSVTLGTDATNYHVVKGDVEINGNTSTYGDVYITGTTKTGGTISTGVGVANNQDSRIEIGGERTGDGNAYIDFHSSQTTQPDYSARIIRSPGVNGGLWIQNKGTGNINIDTGTGNFGIVRTGSGTGYFQSNFITADRYYALPDRTGFMMTTSGPHIADAGSKYLGNPGTDTSYTVALSTTLPNTAYWVMVTLRAVTTANWNYNNDCSFCVHDRQTSSFKLAVRDHSPDSRAELYADWIIFVS